MTLVQALTAKPLPGRTGVGHHNGKSSPYSDFCRGPK